MNFFPLTSRNSLVKNLPLYVSRSNPIKYLLAFNLSFSLFYYTRTGPTKQLIKESFQLSNSSNVLSPVLSSLLHTNPLSLGLNCAALYTLGNYHVLKYGATHFLGVFGAGCLAGSALTLLAL